MDFIGLILAIAYIAWSLYAGYKVVSGRSEWLDRDVTLNKIVKFIVCFVVGYTIAAFYFIYWLFRAIRGCARV